MEVRIQPVELEPTRVLKLEVLSLDGGTVW